LGHTSITFGGAVGAVLQAVNKSSVLADKTIDFTLMLHPLFDQQRCQRLLLLACFHQLLGFRIRLHQKDLNLALQAGRELGVALPNTASTQQLFAAVAAAGGGDLDHSGLVKALETLAAHPVAPDA
jgi:hypothetical protein